MKDNSCLTHSQGSLDLCVCVCNVKLLKLLACMLSSLHSTSETLGLMLADIHVSWHVTRAIVTMATVVIEYIALSTVCSTCKNCRIYEFVGISITCTVLM